MLIQVADFKLSEKKCNLNTSSFVPDARLNVLPLIAASLGGGENQFQRDPTMGTCLITPS